MTEDQGFAQSQTDRCLFIKRVLKPNAVPDQVIPTSECTRARDVSARSDTRKRARDGDIDDSPNRSNKRTRTAVAGCDSRYEYCFVRE